MFKDAPCVVAEVLSPTTAAIDTREKLQAYGAIESLRYYLLVESERAAVRYRVRGAGDEWLEAALGPGERIEIECGAVRASWDWRRFTKRPVSRLGSSGSARKQPRAIP